MRYGIVVLKSFIEAVRVSVGDIEFGLDIDAEQGAAGSGGLEIDLPSDKKPEMAWSLLEEAERAMKGRV